MILAYFAGEAKGGYGRLPSGLKWAKKGPAGLHGRERGGWHDP